jgi:hypothetical protein
VPALVETVAQGQSWYAPGMTRLRGPALVALCVFVASAPAALADITGRASVIDGDTIEVRGERIKLEGIDAPERGQLCEADGQRWRCGQQAALALADRVGTRNVTCTDRGTDNYGRVLAIRYLEPDSSPSAHRATVLGNWKEHPGNVGSRTDRRRGRSGLGTESLGLREVHGEVALCADQMLRAGAGIDRKRYHERNKIPD